MNISLKKKVSDHEDLSSTLGESAKLPTVEWQITGKCNYRCSYCIQGKHPKISFQPHREQINRALDALIALPGSWEIKISGGEPFVSASFLDLVIPRIIQESKHYISILSNLSASTEELARFADLCRDRLKVISASYHPEFTSLKDFLNRSKFLQHEIGNRLKIKVNIVLLPGQIYRHFYYRFLVKRRGLNYYGQFYKNGGQVWRYNFFDKLFLFFLLGKQKSPHKVNRAPSYKGSLCEAGRKYFIIQKEGDAWVCRSARRKESKTAEKERQYYMGNIFNGDFSLRSEAFVCPFSICPCSVPYNRGFIRTK